MALIYKYYMKIILVEGQTDSIIVRALFGDKLRDNTEIRITHGFSSMIAMAKTLIDYDYKVLLVADSDSNDPNNNVRSYFERYQTEALAGRRPEIVWMEPCIENVISRAHVDARTKKGLSSANTIKHYKADILRLTEFKKISDFLNR